MKTYLGFEEFPSAVNSVSVYKNVDLSLFENCCMVFVVVSYCGGCLLFAPYYICNTAREVTEQFMVLK